VKEDRFTSLFRSGLEFGADMPHGGRVHAGLQTVRPQDGYLWNGLKRSADSRRPTWLFQYTFEGWGLLQTGNKIGRVPEGHAFSVKIPSNHEYRSDEKCPQWKFFWVMTHHEYIGPRLWRNRRLLNQVIRLPEESAPMQAVTELLKTLVGKNPDPVRCEELLLTWMLEIERWSFDEKHPEAPRLRLLNWANHLLEENWERFLKVESLAEARGLSRSNFAHYFRSVTGVAPGHYLRERRLEKATNLLRENMLSIKEVAAATGFADANHFCKNFRARFQMSPGEFRRLRGSRR